jgi:hypothetical protein
MDGRTKKSARMTRVEYSGEVAARRKRIHEETF